MVFEAMGEWFGRVLAPFASNIVVAVVVLLLGIIIARIIERVIAKVLHELEINQWLKKAGVNFALEETVSAGVRYILYFLAVVVALNQVGLTTTVLNFLAGAIIILVLAAILLGIKDFIPNFVAGLQIHRRGVIKKGDTIRVREIQGVVKQINLLDTQVESAAGDVIFVPNSTFTKHAVHRYTRKKRNYSKKKRK